MLLLFPQLPKLRDAEWEKKKKKVLGSTKMRKSGNFPQPGVSSTTRDWDLCDSSLSSSSATAGGMKQPNPLESLEKKMGYFYILAGKLNSSQQ